MFGKLTEALQGATYGFVAKKIERGDFGPWLAKAYIATKGYVTWTSSAVAIIASAAAYYGDSHAATIIAKAAVVAAGLGLIRKGVDLDAPGGIPDALRLNLELALSWGTALAQIAQLVALSLQGMGEPWALAISGNAQLVALGLSSVTGFMATLLHKTAPPEH